MAMPTLTDSVPTLYSLFDRFAQAKARTETPKQGCPFTYADKGLILFFLLRHARAIDRFKAQRRWRKTHAEMLPLLHFEAVSKSRYQGWVYGYGLHLSCNEAASPELIELETASISESAVLEHKAEAILERICPETLTADNAYTKALRIRSWARQA